MRVKWIKKKTHSIMYEKPCMCVSHFVAKKMKGKRIWQSAKAKKATGGIEREGYKDKIPRKG